MTDRRRLASNGRVAAARLRGLTDATRFVEGESRQAAVPVVDLCDVPDGRRERQLLAGQTVTSFETREGWCFIEAAADGYVGYVPATDLSTPTVSTHVVAARATHGYCEPDFKAPERESLSLGSRLQVIGTEGRFAETERGFVPSAHLRPLDSPESDPVAVAERLLGTPYLWGGNSAFGIDCSGLVQIACTACGIACPGDSDMQEAELGRPLGNRPLRRGDLLFWKGHVAWAADAATLLHANAHHMAVAYEEAETAIARIESQGDGPVIARKRLEELH